MDPQPSTTTGPSSNWVVDKSSLNPKKIIRFSSLKRGKEEVPLTEKVKLERVIGLTVTSNVSLACDPITGAIIYPAGCAVVIYNPRKNKQTHIINASKKTITTLAVSIDGKYIVTGECGHQPHVRVWDVQEKTQVAEFPGHKFGINCVAFSPNQKYVVSIGSQHDMIVNVWEWRSNTKVASNKVSSKVKAVAFSEDGGHFVTVGNRHVKFWYLEYFRSTKYKDPVPLMGRSAILGDQRNNYFCDVACGRGDVADSTFAITKSGLLCEFSNRRLLDKWVELRTSSANCLSVGIDYIFIGCADGIVRCFSPYTLQFLTTLPRTHHLGVDVAKGLTIAHMGSQPPSAKYPDCIAVVLDESNNKVTCIYNDHSLYMWDIHDVQKVGKSYSFLSHSACIWGVEVYPADVENPLLPKGSFITCSSDDTIRIWNLEQNLSNETAFKKNVYSSELLKILYIDENLLYVCDKDHNAGSNEKVDTTYDSRNGVRCIKVSPDGRHLASGDRSGNIRIHDIQYMEEQCKIEAHDAEVLCLEYSKLESNNRYLASASRDRLIHVFDVDNDYVFLQTLDDHSSSITSVRFVQQGGQLQMISCGADKSVIFRTAQFNPSLHFSRAHHVVGKTTLYDMEVDCNQKYILTACQDRNIRVYNINNGKHTRTFKGSQGEDGTLIKIVLDNSGLFVATSSTDKNLCIYDFVSGECVATMFGHSEIVTGFRFSNDGKHLISVSGDGCIFVWKLPPEITQAIQIRSSQLRNINRIKQETMRKTMYSIPQQLKPPASPDFDSNNLATMATPNTFEIQPSEPDENGAYRFSVGPLPLWAKKQIADDALSADAANRSQNVAQPRGRWAQRIDSQGIVVKSIYDTGHVIPFPGQTDADEIQNGSDVRRETITLSKPDTDVHDDFEPCSDSLSQIKSANVHMPEELMGPITTLRGSNIDFMRNHHHHPSDNRFDRPIVDDLDLDQDGDIADDETDSTDTDFQETIYYPPLEHSSSFSASEFKVCNTNPDDLREAHRKNKKLRAEKPSDIPSLYIQGVRSTDSEDEEDLTTPYTTDRNLLSGMYSVSTESLDRVGQREKFLKNNFESLSGDKDLDDLENNDNRLSISAQFLSKSLCSSKEPVNQLKTEQECASPKKLEVMKKLEETRKKLDTIGWKASLNNSKSITDLTHIPEKDVTFKHPSSSKGIDCISAPQTMTSSMPDLCTNEEDAPNDEEIASPFFDSHTNKPLPTFRNTSSLADKKPLAQSVLSIKGKTSTNTTYGTVSSACKKGVKSALTPSSGLKHSPQLTRQALAKKVTIKQVLPSRCDTDKSETIRRASSMSDLSKPKRLLPSPPFNVGSKGYKPPPDSYGSLRRNSARSSEQTRNNETSRLSRSSSLSTLAITDQDDSRLTRPTISSLNKARGGQDVSHRPLPKSASSSHLPRSRRDGYIAGSGTSSGETSPTENKPNLPVRLRSTSVDRSNSAKFARPESRISVSARSTASARSMLSSSRATSERDLTKLARGVTEKISNTPNNIAAANITVTKTSKHELFLKPNSTATSTTTTRRAVSVSLADGLLGEQNKMLEKSPQELPVKDNKPKIDDIFNAPLTRSLCEMTADELKLAADNVLQLCKRISMENDLTETERLELIDILSQAVNQAHTTLKPIPSTLSVSPELSQVPLNKKGSEQPGGVENNMSSLLQQYSDMLLTLVQQRMNTQPGTV